MSVSRIYATRRQGIVRAIAEKLKTINGIGDFFTDLNSNVFTTLKFWDEVDTFPEVHVTAGPETREYLAAGVKNRFLTVIVRCYINQENSLDALDALIEDVETVLEDNSKLFYYDKKGSPQAAHQITIVSIETDEGLLDPLGVGDVLIEVRY